MTMLASGFLLGIVGSLHCVAMCGPLVMAVLSRRGGRAAAIYHGARLVMYALLGVAAGALGHLAGLAGAGRVLSVAAGVGLIVTALGGWSRAGSWPASWRAARAGTRARRVVTRWISAASRGARARWRDASLPGLAAAGALNGLLPCGSVYAALAAAAALGSGATSAAFMLAFGAGTVPSLVFGGTLAGWISRRAAAGARWKLVAPAALIVVGLMLTARGLMPPHHHAGTGGGHQSHDAHGEQQPRQTRLM